MDQDIYPPVVLQDDDLSKPCFSVDVYLPQDLRDEYERLAKEADPDLPFVDIHGALYLYRGSEMTAEQRRADVVAAIQAGIDSGPGTLVTPEFWEEFKRSGEIRLQERQALRAAGQTGLTSFFPCRFSHRLSLLLLSLRPSRFVLEVEGKDEPNIASF